MQGGSDAYGEGGDLLGGLEEIGNHDDLEAGGVGGTDAGERVFERKTPGGIDVESAGGFEVDVGGGLAAGDLVAGHDG